MTFAKQLASVRASEVGGRYLAELSEAWNCPFVPNGGVVAAVAAKAMGLELHAPEQRLRTLTAVFCSPVQSGPAVVDVAVHRRGRSMSQATATVRNAETEAGTIVTAVFGGERRGFEYTDLVPPTAPPPEECRAFRDRLPDMPFPMPFWSNVEYRTVVGWHWGEEAPPAPTSERLQWYRYDETPYADDGTVDPLAVLPVCDTMPPAVSMRLGSEAPLFIGPSTDLTVHFLQSPRSEWLLGRNHCRHAGDGYASVDMELWDPEVGLVAYATQLAYLLFVDELPGTP